MHNGRIQELNAGQLSNHPFYDQYHEVTHNQIRQDHYSKYILASYSTAIHVTGSLASFKRTGSEKKWIRLHNTNEWYDVYLKESLEDFDKFLASYLKTSIMNRSKHPVSGTPSYNVRVSRAFLTSPRTTILPKAPHTSIATLQTIAE